MNDNIPMVVFLKEKLPKLAPGENVFINHDEFLEEVSKALKLGIGETYRYHRKLVKELEATYEVKYETNDYKDHPLAMITKLKSPSL